MVFDEDPGDTGRAGGDRGMTPGVEPEGEPRGGIPGSRPGVSLPDPLGCLRPFSSILVKPRVFGYPMGIIPAPSLLTLIPVEIGSGIWLTRGYYSCPGKAVLQSYSIGLDGAV